MAVVGTAYVKVQALSTGLAEEIRRSVKQAIKEASAGLDKDMEEAGRRHGKSYGKGFGDGVDEHDLSDNIRNAVERGAADVDRDVTRGGDRAGRNWTKSFGNGIKSALPSLTNYIKWGSIFTLAPGAVNLAGGLIGSLITEAAAAVDGLAMAIGGLGLIAGAALPAVAVGFLGIKMAMAGNEEAAKAFKDELGKIGKELSKPVAEGFFGPANEAVKMLRERLIGNEGIANAFRYVGDVLGRTMLKGVDKLTADTGRLERIIGQGAGTLQGFGDFAIGVGDALLTALDVARPFTAELGAMATRAGDWISATINAKAASGELLAFFQKLWEAVFQAGRILRDFGAGIVNFFKAAAPQAASMGDSLETIAAKFRAWTESDAGQKKLQNFFSEMHRISQALGPLFKDVFGSLASGVAGVNADAAIAVIENIRTVWLPAIKEIAKQISDAVGGPEGSGTFFENIGGTLQKIADSGAIEKIVSGMSDFVKWIGELANSDITSKISDIGGAFLGLPLAVFGAMRLLKMTLSGGMTKAVPAAGLLAVPLAAYFGAEILAAASPENRAFVDGLEAVPGHLIGAMVKWARGDFPAAKAEWKEVTDWWDKDVIGWAKKSIDDYQSVTAGLSALRSKDQLTEDLKVFANSAMDGAKKWDEAAAGIINSSDKIGAALGLNAPKVKESFTSIIQSLDQANIKDHPGLSTFRDAIGMDLQAIVDALDHGDTDIGSKVDTLKTNLDHMVEVDPNFAPIADKIKQQLDAISAAIKGDTSPEALQNMITALGNVAITDPGLGPLATNIQSQLVAVRDGIEQGATDVPDKLKALLTSLAGIDSSSALAPFKEGILAQLRAAGVDVDGAMAQIGTGASAALNQGLQQVPGQISGLIGQINAIPGPDLGNFKGSINAGIQGLIGAINSGQGDISGQVQALAQLFATAPPTFEPMRESIVSSLSAAGVDIASIAPSLLTPLTPLPGQFQSAGQAAADGLASGLRGAGPAAGAALSTVPPAIGGALSPAGEVAKAALLKVPENSAAAVQSTAAVVASGLQGTPGAVSQALAPAATAATGAMSGVPTAAGAAVQPTAGQVQAGLVTVPASVLASLDPSVAAAATAMAPVPTTAQQAVAGTPGAVQAGLSGVPGAVSTALAPSAGAVSGAMTPAEAAMNQSLATMKMAPGQNLAGTPAAVSAQLAQIAPVVSIAMNAAMNAMLQILNLMRALPGVALAGIAGVVSAALSGITGAVVGIMIGTLNAMTSYMSAMTSKMASFVSDMRSKKQEIDQILAAALAAKTAAETAGAQAKAALATAQAQQAAADSAKAAAAAAAAATVNSFVPPQGWTIRHVLSAADFGALNGGYWSPPYGRGLSGTRVAHITMPEPVVKTTSVPSRVGETVNVQVYIGQSELEEIIDKRVSYNDAVTDRQLRHGRRGVTQ